MRASFAFGYGAAPDRVSGLRDRALIGLMTYTFARIGAALKMEVRDVYIQNRRLWVRLQEKGGKRHEMPCHHALENYLDAYLEASGLRENPKSPLFRTIGRETGQLTEPPLFRAIFQLLRKTVVFRSAIFSKSVLINYDEKRFLDGDVRKLEIRQG